MAATKAATPEHAYLSVTLRGLKAKAGDLDMPRAMLEPEWHVDEDGLEESPDMEVIEFAEMKTCVLYASIVKDSHLATAPAGAPKISWALYMMPDHDQAVGGPADTLEQAKQFAQSAYQATCGLIVGGDA